jgi:5-methyltetrahydrofolate--homocysteine methyltransferase
MADIALRFHKDPLVLSAPIDELLARQGVDNPAAEREYMDLIEPESVFELQKLDPMVGAHCLVTNTYDITRARLAHARFEEQSAEIARASVDILRDLKPQHIIASIGPTRLPIDPESASSMKQNRNQYARAVQDFGEGIDAVLLDGMVSLVDLKCALAGAKKVTDLPVFASVDLDAAGKIVGRDTTWEEALAVMSDFEADVVGFSTAAPLDAVLPLVQTAVDLVPMPLLVQLKVGEHDPRDVNPGFRPVEITPDNPYRTPDAIFDAATALLNAGAQFLRAVGHATPSYTGALVIAGDGRDCVR